MKKATWLLNAAVLLFYSGKPALCASVRYAVCEDSTTFQIVHGDEDKSCKWLQTQQAQIRDEFCKDIEVRTHCSHSCGTCCWDDKAFRFKMESGRKSRSCYWLSKTSKRMLKYCNADENIRQSCRKSCGFCGSSSNMPQSSYEQTAEMESSSIPKSSVLVNKDSVNTIRQSPNEVQNNHQDEGKGSGLFGMFITMIIFSLIFGVFFKKRIGQNVVTFKNVIISKDETEKVSVILKTLWEAKMKPQH